MPELALQDLHAMGYDKGSSNKGMHNGCRKSECICSVYGHVKTASVHGLLYCE